MRILWVGFHVEGIPAFKAITDGNWYIVGCISLDEGRKAKRSGSADYSELCRAHNIPYYEVAHINDHSTVEIIKGLRPDILVVLGWSQLLSDEILTIPSIGVIGAHASMLPAYRGSAPINWAIINGLTKTGNTLMWLDSGVDTGLIIDQMSFRIDVFDTCHTLYKKVAQTNKIMLLKALKNIHENGKYGVMQEHTDIPILPRRTPKDGLIDFNKDAKEVYNFIRAITRPYPGAFTYFSGGKLKIWNAGYSTAAAYGRAKPGTIVDKIYNPDFKRCAVVVACKSGTIFIHEIENSANVLLTGKRLMQSFNIGDKFTSKDG